VKVGDLVKSDTGFVGIIVGINPLDARAMVKWNHLPFAYPECQAWLEVISESKSR